jgi:glycosyltransferase involved in cell wall biosynthesis
MSADLSVVICSLNGAEGVDRCLRALADQKDVDLEVIVVDDGSTDQTSEVGRERGATVIRHEVNRGLAAARNTGVRAATAPVVAFLDDDCEPEPAWARELLAGYDAGVVGVGGTVVPCAPDGFMLGYLQRNNPLLPLELDLAVSESIPYRLYRYALRQWQPDEPVGQRDVWSLVGANMSFLRSALLATPFDERFRFGAEDLDLCLQLPRDHPGGRLVMAPAAVVKHHFVPGVRDTLRRARGYGRGCARLYRKWPSMNPTIYPGPFLVVAALIAAVFFPLALVAAVVLPQLMYPKGIRLAVTRRQPAALLDPYVQVAEEGLGNVGYIKGMWTFRHLVPEPAAPAQSNQIQPPASTSTVTAAPASQASVGSTAWQ